MTGYIVFCLYLYLLSMDGYLSDSDANRCEILHDGRAVYQNELLPYWWRYV